MTTLSRRQRLCTWVHGPKGLHFCKTGFLCSPAHFPLKHASFPCERPSENRSAAGKQLQAPGGLHQHRAGLGGGRSEGDQDSAGGAGLTSRTAVLLNMGCR